MHGIVKAVTTASVHWFPFYRCTGIQATMVSTVNAGPQVLLIHLKRFIIEIMLIIIHNKIFIVLSSTARGHMREITLGHLDKSRSSPAGRQLIGQATHLTFVCDCRLNIHPSPSNITQTYGWYLFTVPRRVEGWVDLGTAVSVQPMPKAAHQSNFHEKHRNLSTYGVRSWDL